MIIEREVSLWSVSADAPITEALRRLDANHKGFILGVDEYGVLEGVLTDGDVRRWLMGQAAVNLTQPVRNILVRTCVVAQESEAQEDIRRRFSDRIKFIPLLDARRRLIGVVRRRGLLEGLRVGERLISDESPVFVIAEIGINHNGSVEMARRLVRAAKDARVDAVKFQMRSMAQLYRHTPGGSVTGEDLGAQYTLNLLEKFELPVPDMLSLFDYARDQGLSVLCTPWEEESLRVLEEYGMEAYKVASADLTNHPFLEKMARTYKPLILSTGMSTEDEIVETVKVLRRNGSSYALLHCNSTYPAPFKDINLAYLARLKAIGGCPVGYSGHERGIHVATSAVCQGAKIIEKHITLDRSLEGSDHKASLLPDEFRAMVEGIRQVEESIGSGHARTLSQGELMNRSNLAKSLVAARDIAQGEEIDEHAVEIRSPGRGLQPNRKAELIGRRALRDLKKGDFFFASDIEQPMAQARNYRFSRPWGVTVRWHDFQEIRKMSNPDFVEFHLSFKDMEEDFTQFFDGPLDLDFKVHSPDTFNGDHLLDLSNPDEEHRKRSVAELQRVVDLTRKLKPYFRKATRPVIIVSLGGFSRDGFLAEADVSKRYEIMARSLRELDANDVEIIGQTLPPFPWYFGGQMYLNLFVRPEDTVAFCRANDLRLCFDISHSKLACTHYKTSFKEFVDQVGPLAAHLHMADARGTDGEGLQIGEGELDFPALCAQLKAVCPEASFMPEIWQGHKNRGEGFWTALERLERFGL
ncbi:MAG: N-acetylneuraminate synthase family protein [Kiritimatiellae bacterium]|nr:N-acetylneuraminate synthase family protein [Kiritimatiellia bacterium]MCO5061580.1 N-acetylneuraminate synthase family protein [Kiritimatiellia bacterium]MCO5067365.1 N-acetylneuraminate synthase family protein [Kiritimatiellia bacterium]